MLCKSCGLESKASDFCDWCKKPMNPNTVSQGQPMNPTHPSPPKGQPLNAPYAPPPFAGQTMNPQNPQPLTANAMPPIQMPPQTRISLTGEVVEVEPSQSAAFPTQPMPTYALPNAAITPLTTQGDWQPEINLGERWEKFLALFLPCLALSVLILHFNPGLFLWIALADLFLLGIMLGASTAIPSYDDAVADCTVVLVLTYLFGPLVAFVIYGIVGLIKQEANVACLALLLGNYLCRTILAFVVFSSAGSSVAAMIMPFTLFGLLSFFTVLITFFGWLMSSFFRPLEAR